MSTMAAMAAMTADANGNEFKNSGDSYYVAFITSHSSCDAKIENSWKKRLLQIIRSSKARQIYM